MGDIARRLDGQRLALFLDFDGTLTPIVDHPERAVLSNGMRETLEVLSERCLVAVVSGRRREDVMQRVGVSRLCYAGSHGFDIAGPHGCEPRHVRGHHVIPVVAQAERELVERLGSIPGVLIEEKTTALAVHYRRVADADVAVVEAAVDAVIARHPDLRKTGGKRIFELRPREDWDKGKAVLWLLDALDLGGDDVTPIYLGDDVTDEDAFAALKGRGIGIHVSDRPQPTSADYGLRDPDEVHAFLEALNGVLDGGG